MKHTLNYLIDCSLGIACGEQVVHLIKDFNIFELLVLIFIIITIILKIVCSFNEFKNTH